MRPAEIERTTADIDAGGAGRPIMLRAVGSVVTFDGFLALYGVAAKEDARGRGRGSTAANCRRSPSAIRRGSRRR
jgi:DNA topoisomerase IA